MMAAAVLVGQISIGIEDTVIVTLGLSAISMIGLLIAVFIGVALVSKEMDKCTLYALLAKPVRRWEFLLGKFGGLVLTLAVNTAAMALGLLVVMLLCEALAAEKRRSGAGGRVFHFAEACTRGSAGRCFFPASRRRCWRSCSPWDCIL